MQVRVLFFGMLRDLAGVSSESLPLPDRARLADVWSRYEQRFPKLKTMARSVAMSVNQEYATPDTELKPGDEVAFLPPVSGGAPGEEATRQGKHCSIGHEPIDTPRLLDALKHPEDGAAVLFEGVVRNHSRDRRTLFLDYEAYEDMALKKMDELAAEALSRFAVRDVRLAHRLGRLQVGETSVAIVVASAHRAAGFDACRWLIDSLKRTVPIWKKEHFEDGAVWADGEPFPTEIVRSGSSHPGEPASK